jgi:MOSC domain-containing protein
MLCGCALPFFYSRPFAVLNPGASGHNNWAMPDAEIEARVTRLTVYPVKGLAGQPVEAAEVQERGFAWDRRWMLVGEDQRFLTQRQLPKLATFKAAVSAGELVLRHGETQITVPVEPPESVRKIRVTIWNDQVEAVLLPDVGPWLSPILDHRCDLVFMPDTTRRPVNPRFARAAEIVSFADAYPVLLIGEASLADLNGRLDGPVPMDRFRPNIVVSSAEPFAEDTWGELEIGSARLSGTKACDRCSVPTVDQLTGERTGPEPIRTLSSYRRFGKGAYLGQNLTVRRPGTIVVNDAVVVKKRIEAVYV